MITIKVENLDAANDYLKRMIQSAQKIEKTTYLVGSKLPYAYGISTGRHRRGRLARRAGGVNYLQAGLDSAKFRIARAIVIALPKGPEEGARAMKGVALQVQRGAREAVPVRTGKLRRSLHTALR